MHKLYPNKPIHFMCDSVRALDVIDWIQIERRVYLCHAPQS